MFEIMADLKAGGKCEKLVALFFRSEKNQK